MGEGSPDYTNNVRLLAIAPDGSLVTIMVDATGRIIAVMTGNCLGTPTTLAVDADGHLTATMMGRYLGAPTVLSTDAAGNLNALVQDPQNIFGDAYTIGLSELAVRLGSPSTFERRGTIMWFDRFASGLGHWVAAMSGVGAAITLTNEDSRGGGFSVKLTAGIGTAQLAVISHREIVINLAGLFGVEFSFRSLTAVVAWTQMNITFGLDESRNTFSVQWNQSTKALRILVGVVWTEIDADAELGSENNSWASIKLVVNGTTGDYIRLYAASKAYDLAGYAGRNVVTETPQGITVDLVQYGLDASNAATLVDNVIITSDEPTS
jgi:hypothetical protein